MNVEAANAESDLWKSHDRRHKEKLRRENLEAWRSFHSHMHALHAELAAEHADKARILEGAG